MRAVFSLVVCVWDILCSVVEVRTHPGLQRRRTSAEHLFDTWAGSGWREKKGILRCTHCILPVGIELGNMILVNINFLIVRNSRRQSHRSSHTLQNENIMGEKRIRKRCLAVLDDPPTGLVALPDPQVHLPRISIVYHGGV